MKLDFWVTIDLGRHRSGDTFVTIAVSDEEYELLKQCCRDNKEIEGYEGLEDLYERVVSEAKDESEFCESDDCEDIDYDEAYYTVAMPQAICDEVKKED